MSLARLTAPLTVAALIALPAHAETLEMVTGKGYQPFTDPGLPEGGLATEVVKAALATQDTDVKVEFLPWARGYKQVARGKKDATFPYVRTSDREEEVLFSEPLFEVKPQVISSADNPVKFDGTKASLDGMTVCRPTGYAMSPMLQEMIENDRLDTQDPNNVTLCPKLVKAGRVDFFQQNNFVWPGMVESEGLNADNFHVAEEPITVNNLYVVVGKDHDNAGDLISTINAGLKALRESGEFDKIVKRHVGDMM